MNKKNFLIILAEDICPNLGCYGDPNALTPNLDQFAKDNILFNYCYSAAPVCSAARTSLNLGMYGSTAGVGNHRSFYELPPQIKNFGDYMQEIGYYTIIGKTDFNFPLKSGYDREVPYTGADTPKFASDIIQHIKSAGDKPVFMAQTTAITHQSQYGYTEDTMLHRSKMPRLQESEYQDRETIQVPEYHFSSPEANEIWAQYHEKMTSMDRMFGELITALKAENLYDDTILIFVGDNGHGIPGGKINLWNEGVHVPMIVHVPAEMESQIETEEFEFGKVSNRLTCFVDLLATALSVNNAPIPAHLQGKAFLGSANVVAPTEVYSFGSRTDESFENSRSIHEKDMMYMCDFAFSKFKRLNMYQTTQSPWFVRSMIEEGYTHNISDVDRRALFRQIPRINEELFDLNADPNSLNNIAIQNPAETLRLRNKMFEYIRNFRDDALIPEAIMNEFIAKTGLTAYEILQDDNYYPVKECIQYWSDSMDNVELDANVTNPCLKMIVIKSLCDKGVQFDKFIDDESETVRAYTAYRLERVDVLLDVAMTTTNYILLLYIVDLISNCRNKAFKEVFTKICDRVYAPDTELTADQRFTAAMNSGINMLSLRINTDLPAEILGTVFWGDEKSVNSRMVLDALDLQ